MQRVAVFQSNPVSGRKQNLTSIDRQVKQSEKMANDTQQNILGSVLASDDFKPVALEGSSF